MSRAAQEEDAAGWACRGLVDAETRGAARPAVYVGSGGAGDRKQSETSIDETICYDKDGKGSSHSQESELSRRNRLEWHGRLPIAEMALLALVSLLLTWALATLSVRTAGVQIPQYNPQQSASPVQNHTVKTSWPSNAFDEYYIAPNGTSSLPQPKIFNARNGKHFSLELTQAYPLPNLPPAGDAVYPKARGRGFPGLYSEVKDNITTLVAATDSAASAGDRCSTCITSLRYAQQLARRDPKAVPSMLLDLCTQYAFVKPRDGLSQAQMCTRTFAPQTLGAQYAQLLSYANLDDEDPSDGRYICKQIVGAASGCSLPPPIDLSADDYLDNWFGGSQKRAELHKRNRQSILPRKAGPALHDKRGAKKPLRVLHLSDIHVDPRFLIGSEGACTSGMCCRATSFNSSVATGPPTPQGSLLPSSNVSEPAVYWGNYRCDAPWSLVLAALESVKALNGGSSVDMTLYTGDMVTHDSTYHLSDDLVRYTQQAIFDVFKKYLGNGPVFSAIGNHDTAPSDSAAPRNLPDEKPRNEYSYDWQNLKRLFEAEGWFTHKEAKQVARHYGGYSVSPRKGLRIITLNTDFWYKANVYNYINSTEADNSGILRFLTDELERAERNGERAWIVGHVLSGWDGSNPLPNQSNLFYQIVDHYSPRTIAHIFFGHTHEDQFNVFYANNASTQLTKDAKAFSFMGPSITPLTNVNSAIRFYTVDPETYEVMDFDQYYTPVQDFRGLPESEHGPTWQYLYSARKTYGNFPASAADGTVGNGTVRLGSDLMWPSDAPLNATFWSAVTDEMSARPALVSDIFRKYQGRLSPRSPPCNASCIAANICYMRSGSAILGQQCPQGYASVQGG